jgi:purine-binding chemotaxis protein CheW
MNQVTCSSSRTRKTSTGPIEMCSVRVGDMLFGIPISQILEILGSAHPQPVPLAPSFVGGLIHYRGDMLTTVSIRHLLGMAPLDGSQDVLVLEVPGGCFGVLVDSVGEVLRVCAEDHEPNPSTLDERGKALFTGSYKLKGNLLVIIEPERLDPLRLSGLQAA